MLKSVTISIALLAALSACKKDDVGRPATAAPTPTATTPSATAASPAAAPKTIAHMQVPVTAMHKTTGGASAPQLQLIPIRNAKLSQGVLVGGHPTTEQLAAAAKAGYKTIINLQMPSEAHVAAEEGLVTRLGMKYVSIPVAGAAGITKQNAQALAKALAAATGPTMVHCASGNRVGALYGLKAFHVDKRPAAEAFALAKAAGMTSLTEVLRKLLAL